MRISKVKIVNFCQHEKRDDDFVPGVVGIVGPNGAGKSNYLNAIQRAFTGKSNNEGKKEEDLKWGSDKGSIAVHFFVGPTEGVVKRDLKTTRCSLKFGDREFKSAAEIDASIYEILGVTPKVLSELVFVPQFQIQAVLFQTAAERAKAFQVLFGTERAEYLRDLLHEELQRTVVESKAEQIVQLEAQLKSNVLEPLEIARAARDVLIPKCLSDDKKAEYTETGQDYTSYVSHKQLYDRATEQLQSAELLCTTIRSSVESEKLVMQELETALKDTEEEAKGARERLASVPERVKARAAWDEMKRNLERCKTTLKSTPPASTITDEMVENLRKSYFGAFAEYEASAKVAKLDPRTPKCPTCDQVITVEHIARHRQRAAELEQDVRAKKQLLYEAGKLLADFKKAAAEFAASQAAAAQASEIYEKQLTATPEPHLLTNDQQRMDSELLGLYEGFKKSLDYSTKEKAKFEGALAAAVAQCDIHRARAAEEKAAMGQPVSEQDYNTAKDLLALHDANAMKLAEIIGAIVNMEAQEANMRKQIEDLKAQEAKNGPMLKWKNMCERARLLLHRDNMPNMVAQRFLGAINHKMGQYMEMFDVPFTASIDKDLNIVCTFAGNHTTSAGRLSGGQKVMLGVAFRFAVHELFSSNMGLLVLDEPTLALDEDHVECVFDLLEKVKGYSRTAGLQLIIVTHEQRLTGVFDGVIQV